MKLITYLFIYTYIHHFVLGTVYYPWSGEVCPLPPLLADEAREPETGDPRLVHGALDTGAGANWVRYLGHETGEAVNIEASCGSLGESIDKNMKSIEGNQQPSNSNHS